MYLCILENIQISEIIYPIKFSKDVGKNEKLVLFIHKKTMKHKPKVIHTIVLVSHVHYVLLDTMMPTINNHTLHSREHLNNNVLVIL